MPYYSCYNTLIDKVIRFVRVLNLVRSKMNIQDCQEELEELCPEYDGTVSIKEYGLECFRAGQRIGK